MATKQANKRTTKAARRACSQSGSGEWVDALVERWERREKNLRADYTRTANRNYLGAAQALRACLDELRAESESASTVSS